MGGGSIEKEIKWLKKYGWVKKNIDFGEAKKLIRKVLMEGMQIKSNWLKKIFLRDLETRWQQINDILEKQLPGSSGKELDHFLKEYEFWQKNSLNPKIYDDLSERYREIVYRVHTSNQPTKEEYLEAEDEYKKRLTKILNEFIPSITVEKIKNMPELQRKIGEVKKSSEVIVEYEKMDKFYQHVEQCLDKFWADWEHYVQLQVDIARGK